MLTDDILVRDPRTGLVHISSSPSTSTRPEGTALIRNLINTTRGTTEVRMQRPAPMGGQRPYALMIPDMNSSFERTAEVWIYTGTEYTFIIGSWSNTETHVVDRNNGLQIVLAHELIHAERFLYGHRASFSIFSNDIFMIPMLNLYFDLDGRLRTQWIDYEEVLTIRRENLIRREQGMPFPRHRW